MLGVLFVIVIYYRSSKFTPWLFWKIRQFLTTPGAFPYFCAHNLIRRMLLLLLAGISPACLSQIFVFCPCMMFVGEMGNRRSESLSLNPWILPKYLWVCKFVNKSVPLQITLGVLFIIVQISSLLGYFGKFDNFLLPQEHSHIFCAHNLIRRMLLLLLAGVSPACLSWIFVFCPCMMLVGEMAGMICPCLLVLQGTVRIVFGHEIGQHTPNVWTLLPSCRLAMTTQW